jgi:tetratricopeptide (TPR) repeat protein
LDKANQFRKQKNYEKAIETYSKVIKRTPRLQSAYFGRGLTYFKTKKYSKALYDFDKVIQLQTIGGYIFSFNKDMPHASDEIRAQVPHFDVLYQRAQAKFYMDSLESSFNDFQILVENSSQMKSNSLLWQGIIYVKTGEMDLACELFRAAGNCASSDQDKSESLKMISTYCLENYKNHTVE